MAEQQGKTVTLAFTELQWARIAAALWTSAERRQSQGDGQRALNYAVLARHVDKQLCPSAPVPYAWARSYFKKTEAAGV